MSCDTWDEMGRKSGDMGRESDDMGRDGTKMGRDGTRWDEKKRDGFLPSLALYIMNAYFIYSFSLV